MAKETALLALARLDSVRAEQFLAFWEGELRDVYRYKLMLASLDAGPPLEADTFLRVALENAHRQILSLLVQLLAVWASPEVARLVESGLHDTDRRKRASALEALESLSERRFTRLFLPILEAGDTPARGLARGGTPPVVADHHGSSRRCWRRASRIRINGWPLARCSLVRRVPACWGRRGQGQLEQLAEASTDSDVLNTVGRALGMETFESHRALSLTDIMLFLKRIPLYGSMTLDQLRTIAAHLTEREMLPGEIIFREGDRSHELYLIVSGKVDIVKHFGATPHTLATCRPVISLVRWPFLRTARARRMSWRRSRGSCWYSALNIFGRLSSRIRAISFEIFRVLSFRIRRFDEETMEAARSLEDH